MEELNEKLRATEEREANLLVELSELREQNELLEFRLLELEESPARRENPDHTADSGIVSPELLHPSKVKKKSRCCLKERGNIRISFEWKRFHVSHFNKNERFSEHSLLTLLYNRV